jgi:hypothetical protein
MDEPSPQDQPPAQTGRAPQPPQWLPPNYWDGATGAIKPEFGEHYAEAARGYEDFQRLSARRPDDIQITVPKDLKAPAGFALRINEKDPRIPALRELALKNRMSQQEVDQLIALDARQKIEEHAADVAKTAEDEKKLGANAGARKSAVTAWLGALADRGDLDPAEYEELRMTAMTAGGVTALEKIIARVNGTVPGNSPGAPPPAPPKTLAERMYPNGAFGTKQK